MVLKLALCFRCDAEFIGEQAVINFEGCAFWECITLVLAPHNEFSVGFAIEQI
jgi:hypothetical protein